MVKRQQDSEYNEKTLKLGTERDSEIRGNRASGIETQWYRDSGIETVV